MGRPFYPHEADDPDLDWLVSNFLYERPQFYPVEVPGLPLLLIPYREDDTAPRESTTNAPANPVRDKQNN